MNQLPIFGLRINIAVISMGAFCCCLSRFLVVLDCQLVFSTLFCFASYVRHSVWRCHGLETPTVANKKSLQKRLISQVKKTRKGEAKGDRRSLLPANTKWFHSHLHHRWTHAIKYNTFTHIDCANVNFPVFMYY